MKRLIAKYKIRRTCSRCNKQFKKGDIYYKIRNIITDFDDIVTHKTYVFAWNDYFCPKCKYKIEQHNKREKEWEAKTDGNMD